MNVIIDATKMYWKLVVGSFFLLVFSLVLLSFVSPMSDSHNTSIRFIAWKWGYGSYENSQAMRFINLDPEFRDSLKGKTLDEVRHWFPDLRKPGENTNSYQDRDKDYTIGKDFRWIGESNWGIEFVNGRVHEFDCVKG